MQVNWSLWDSVYHVGNRKNITYARSCQVFSIKSQTVNFTSFVGHKVPVEPTQLCQLQQETDRINTHSCAWNTVNIKKCTFSLLQTFTLHFCERYKQTYNNFHGGSEVKNPITLWQEWKLGTAP